MNKKELIAVFGENMRDFWQILEAMLDDAKAEGYRDGYSECVSDHLIPKD